MGTPAAESPRLGRILGLVFLCSWPFLIASALWARSWQLALLFNGLGMLGAGAGAAAATRGQVQGRSWSRFSAYLAAVGFALVVWAPPVVARLINGEKPVSLVQLPLVFAVLFLYPIMGLGEEVAWRGVLLPKLAHLGERKAVALVGAVWGCWHAPLIAVPLYRAPLQIQSSLPPFAGHALQAVSGVALLAVAEIPLSAVFAWFWGRYRSLPVLAVLHGSYDGVRDGLGALMGPPGSAPGKIVSAIMATALLIFGALLLARGNFGLEVETLPKGGNRRR